MIQAKDQIFASSNQKFQSYFKQIEILIQVLNSLHGKQSSNLQKISTKNYSKIYQLSAYPIYYSRAMDVAKIGDRKNWDSSQMQKWHKNPSEQCKQTKQTNILKVVHIGVSPLVRAKQTACLVKPHGYRTHVHIESILCENSEWPSGDSVTSTKEVEDQYEQTSFLKNPLQTAFMKMSLIFYGSSEIYDQIRRQSLKADKTLLESSINQTCLGQNSNKDNIIQLQTHTHSYYKNGKFDHKQNIHIYQTKSLTRQHKISQIYNLILRKQIEHHDYWLFGHSNNFTSFFNHYFSIIGKFMYCETRSVYKLRINDDKDQKQQKTGDNRNSDKIILYHPCYDFYIDQDDGTIRGLFVPNSYKFYQGN